MITHSELSHTHTHLPILHQVLYRLNWTVQKSVNTCILIQVSWKSPRLNGNHSKTSKLPFINY